MDVAFDEFGEEGPDVALLGEMLGGGAFGEHGKVGLKGKGRVGGVGLEESGEGGVVGLREVGTGGG